MKQFSKHLTTRRHRLNLSPPQIIIPTANNPSSRKKNSPDARSRAVFKPSRKIAANWVVTDISAGRRRRRLTPLASLSLSLPLAQRENQVLPISLDFPPQQQSGEGRDEKGSLWGIHLLLYTVPTSSSLPSFSSDALIPRRRRRSSVLFRSRIRGKNSVGSIKLARVGKREGGRLGSFFLV